MGRRADSAPEFSPTAPPTRARYVFLAYAAFLSLILYLDRICIAESAGAIAGELGLSDEQRGWMFTAFTLGYLLFVVPRGAWGDRFGPKRVLVAEYLNRSHLSIVRRPFRHALSVGVSAGGKVHPIR